MSEKPESLPYKCKEPQYVRKDHGHIIIGDLRVVSEFLAVNYAKSQGSNIHGKYASLLTIICRTKK